MGTAIPVKIRVTERYRVPPERVFDAWLDPALASTWLFSTASHPVTHVEIDARPGGAFRFVEQVDGARVEHCGAYVEIVRPRRLVFTLSMKNSPRVATRVTAEIAPLKNGCELRLVHENVPTDYASHVEGRWSGMLYGLGTKLGRSSKR